MFGFSSTLWHSSIPLVLPQPAWQAVQGEGKGQNKRGRIEHAFPTITRFARSFFPLSLLFGPLPKRLWSCPTSRKSTFCHANVIQLCKWPKSAVYIWYASATAGSLFAFFIVWNVFRGIIFKLWVSKCTNENVKFSIIDDFVILFSGSHCGEYESFHN